MPAGRDHGPEHFRVWHVTESAGFESAWVAIDGLRLRAESHVAGQLPEPHWLSYILETDERAATTRLELSARTQRSERRLDLRRDVDGWTVDGESRPDLTGALDCDIASSPVTNTMPILRHGLHQGPGGEHFLMAFVEVPTLRVVAVRQEYSQLGLGAAGARVRYSSGDFSSDLLVDEHGLVIEYPTMAVRLAPDAAASARERSGGAGTTRPGAAP
jgi:hypothetical protein